MEVLRIDENKNTLLCKECQNVLKYKINHDTFSIDSECKNGHFFNSTFRNFFLNCKHTFDIKKPLCHQCFTIKESNSYLCQTCNILFCEKCMNKHLKTKKHIFVKFNDPYKSCQKHNKIYSYFCDECKDNICEDCLINHKNHFIKSIFDIIPNNVEKESLKEKTTNIEEKIKNINTKLGNWKRLIDERYDQLKKYFNFLLSLNKRLFQNFNFSIFDYYNYENYNYMNNLFNNKTIFDEKRYFNYLYFGNSLKIDVDKKQKNNNNINEKILVNINDKNNLNVFTNNLKSMEHFKDNLFINMNYYRYSINGSIQLYEYKNFSLNHISTFELSNFINIDLIKKAKYSDNLLINFYNRKNIKILEFDNKNKKFILSESEIDPKCDTSRFQYFIDLKNGNIVTADNTTLNVWEKNKNNNSFNQIIVINKSHKLFNVNERMFLGQTNYILHFYDCKKYENIGITKVKEPFNNISTLNNELLLLTSKNENNKIILISLKYFEIVQIIELCKDYHPLIARNNCLIQYCIKKNQLRIMKNIYNEKEGSFNEKIEKKIKIIKRTYSNYSRVQLTDNNLLLISDYRSMSVLSDIL